MKTLNYTFENGNAVSITCNNSHFPAEEYFWAVEELLRLKRHELGIRGIALYSTVHPHNPDEPDDLDLEIGIDPETPSTEEFEIALSAAASEAEAKLPFDVEIGHVRFRKGVKLITLIAAARRWYDKAFDGDHPLASVVAEPQVD